MSLSAQFCIGSRPPRARQGEDAASQFIFVKTLATTSPSRTRQKPSRPARCAHESCGLQNLQIWSPCLICSFKRSQRLCVNPNGTGFGPSLSSWIKFSRSASSTVVCSCNHSFSIVQSSNVEPTDPARFYREATRGALANSSQSALSSSLSLGRLNSKRIFSRLGCSRCHRIAVASFRASSVGSSSEPPLIVAKPESPAL